MRYGLIAAGVFLCSLGATAGATDLLPDKGLDEISAAGAQLQSNDPSALNVSSDNPEVVASLNVSKGTSSLDRVFGRVFGHASDTIDTVSSPTSSPKSLDAAQMIDRAFDKTPFPGAPSLQNQGADPSSIISNTFGKTFSSGSPSGPQTPRLDTTTTINNVFNKTFR